MAQLQQINKLFEKREKQIKDLVLKDIEEIVETEINLFEFELFYSSILKNKDNAKWVKEKRNKDWKKALKQSKGNYEKAMTIFSS